MNSRAEVLTITEVAVELRCSKAHVYNIIAGRVRGVRPLPVLPMGRRKLVRRETLDVWKRDNERVLAGGMLPSSPEIDPVDA